MLTSNHYKITLTIGLVDKTAVSIKLYEKETAEKRINYFISHNNKITCKDLEKTENIRFNELVEEK